MVQRNTVWLTIVVVGLALTLGSGFGLIEAPSPAAAVALEAPPPEEATLPDILREEAEKSEEEATGKSKEYMKEVPMTLDCVNMTEQARDYALRNNLCTTDGHTPEGDLSVKNKVDGDCGSSWIWVYNASRGYARTVYGYHSTDGTVVAHVLRVSWYNWSTGGASGWTDAAGELSSTYETSRTTFTGAGFVTVGLSGFVALWWGGTCTINNPTDWVTVTP